MPVVDLPTIKETVPLSDAYEAMKASGKSGLVVLHEDGARLFHASALELHLQDRSSSPMSEILGGRWLPQATAEDAAEPGGDGIVLSLAGDTASIGGLFDDVARDLTYAVRVYTCSLSPTTHIYTPTMYRALPIVGGVRYCNTKDGGIVS
jgi:hypothetical protein